MEISVRYMETLHDFILHEDSTLFDLYEMVKNEQGGNPNNIYINNVREINLGITIGQLIGAQIEFYEPVKVEVQKKRISVKIAFGEISLFTCFFEDDLCQVIYDFIEITFNFEKKIKLNINNILIHPHMTLKDMKIGHNSTIFLSF